MGRPADAETHARLAIALNPEGGRGWLALTGALIASGRHREAIDSARRAVDLLPDNPQAQAALRAAQEKMGEANIGSAGSLARFTTFGVILLVAVLLGLFKLVCK